MLRTIGRLALLVLLTQTVRADLPTPDPDDTGLVLPPGFRSLVVADNLGPLRFMTIAPNGDIYIKNDKNGIVALRDTTGNGRADMVRNFGDGPGTGIAVHNGWLYYSTDDEVYRYKLNPGELIPTDKPINVVTGLPEQEEHPSKAFAFDPDNNLYVEVGCPSNSSGKPGKGPGTDRSMGAEGVDPTDLFQRHGAFWRFDSLGENQDQLKDGTRFGGGFRHILAIAWNPVSKTFFTVMMGRDQLNTVDPAHFTDAQNAELPAEEMHKLTEHSNFGWPYTYYDPIQKARMVSPEFGGDGIKKSEPGKYEDPVVAFPAHWAPMQMIFYTGHQFPEKYRNGAFVAFHGSWNRAPLPQAGYNVCFVPFNAQGEADGTYEVFADNFKGKPVIMSPNEAAFRPCGLAQGPDGSLYVADSEKGRVWRIIYSPESGPPAAIITPQPPAPEPETTDVASEGDDTPTPADLYKTYCASCHQIDGGGVAHMQPALTNNKYVSGDPTVLIQIVMKGPSAVLPSDRPHFQNTMEPFSYKLDDSQISQILTYVRRNFGNGSSAITIKDVASFRAKMDVAP